MPELLDPTSPDPVSPELLRIQQLEQIRDAFNQAINVLNMPPPGGTWHVVIVPVDKDGFSEEYPTFDELVARLRDLVSGPECQLFVFQGFRLPTTVGGQYLAGPDGSRVPLFVTSNDADLDLTGHAGRLPRLSTETPATSPDMGDEPDNDDLLDDDPDGVV